MCSKAFSRKNHRAHRGAVTVMFAVLAVFIFAVAAFAIDFARVLVVRNELQNAADAAALAGSGDLIPSGANPSGVPDWATAEATARGWIAMNASEGSALSTGTVTSGYWNYATSSWSDTSKTSPPQTDATHNDYPAVKVLISRSGSVNAGPVALTFGRLIPGAMPIPVSAKATAVVSKPVSVGPGYAAPFAVSDCLFTDPTYWNSATNEPVVPQPTLKIGSSAASGNFCNGCLCGQWTTFSTGTNSADDIKEFMNYLAGENAYKPGNATAPPEVTSDPTVTDSMCSSQPTLSSCVFIQDGKETTLYDVKKEIGPLVGQTFAFPVIANDNIGNTGGSYAVLRFACITITAAVHNGSDTHIEGVFSTEECSTGGTGGGGGAWSGVTIPPRLVE